jgi:hypothetical protein
MNRAAFAPIALWVAASGSACAALFAYSDGSQILAALPLKLLILVAVVSTYAAGRPTGRPWKASLIRLLTCVGRASGRCQAHARRPEEDAFAPGREVFG